MGLDIYFEKRKRDYDFTDYRNLIKKRNEIGDQIDQMLEGEDGNAVYQIVWAIMKGETEKLGECISREVELAEQIVPLQKEYNELDKQIAEENPRKQVAYFRKVNLLMVFFNYEGNCEYQLIERGEVEELIDRCKQVLANHELAEELLPTTSGFFFGSTDYDEWYFSDVENVLNTFEQLLEETNWGNEVIEMYAWW